MKIVTKTTFFFIFLLGCSDIGNGKEARQVAEPVAKHTPKALTEGKPEFHYTLFFTDIDKLKRGEGSILHPVIRTSHGPENVPQFLMDKLYEGPSPNESGLRLTHCQTTGAKVLSIEMGKATVQLMGSCGGCGSHSIYDSINATLLELPQVTSVYLLGPDGKSEDGLPSCLQP